MKIKEGFIKKPLMNEVVVVPTGAAAENFSGMVKLNQTASLVWDLVDEGKTAEEIADVLTSKFSVSKEEALADVESIIKQMTDAGFFE